jgi:sortase A
VSQSGRFLRVLAFLLVAAGFVVAAGSGVQWYGKVRHASAEQARLSRDLDARWAPAAATAQAANPANPARPNPARQAPARETTDEQPAPGTPIARLHLPTLGLSLVVLEGTTEAQLRRAPGRIVGTQPLGAPGTTAIAAHRYPGLFWNLDRLSAGDPVVVETAATWLVYRVVRTVIVEPTDQTVLAPPADGAPALLSLATCEPKLSTAQRLVKQAELVRTDPRSGARPRELRAHTRER